MAIQTGSQTNNGTRYLVKRHREYYTGKSQMRWTPYRQFARLYQKRGWAEKAAEKWGGEVVEAGTA